MTSIPGCDTLAWNDDQTRLFLQLLIEETLKGNARKQIVNDAGRQTIINKFYDAFGEKHPWPKFRNKYNTCHKQYKALKKLTHNRTGLGYDSNGHLNMSDHWWNERCKEWPGAQKIKEKPVSNMDLLEKLFGTVHISGAEGWSAQQGEDHLDTIVMPEEPVNESDAASESVQNTHPSNQEADMSHNEPSSSNIPRANKKRKAGQAVADAIRDSIQSRDEILSHKNELIENHPDYSCSQLRAMRTLHSLPNIRMWSPLYKAAIKHLKEDPTNRKTFLCYEDDENKIFYLEFETGESRDA